MDEFNRILSHDLKEPLRNIVSLSQLANQDSDSSPKAKEYTRLVAANGLQVDKLLEDVGAYRSSENFAKNKAALVNTDSLIQEIVADVQTKYPLNKIVPSYIALPEVYANKFILKNVFGAIIDNAVKFQNKEEDALLEVSYWLENKKHHFKFKDNGIGMDPKFQKEIFVMFKRLNNRQTYLGSGLGLSLADKLINRIDGEVSVLESDEGKGSTFLVSFPEIPRN